MAPQYVENGSIYVFRPWVIEQLNNRLGGRIGMYVMGEESAFEIDSALDLQIVEKIIERSALS
jgi:N-acylneuraminate cytidylyltransferase